MRTSLQTRRDFLQLTTGAAAALGTTVTLGKRRVDAARQLHLRKAVKYGMINLPDASVQEKFALIKSLGFAGVELDSPMNIDRAEVVKARDKTGIIIHGVVDSIHWKTRFSDPDPAVRAAGLAGLNTAFEDAKLYGATTVLVVPGKVTNKDTENFEQVWSRSQDELTKILPLAHKYKVKLAIEVVWNDFLTTPDQLVKYVDEFKDPMVGAYFDVSNMVKYGVPSAQWIRKLGKRMFKFDFKGYSNEKKWVAIGEGDEDWPAVRAALAEVGYSGWATSEVKGGGADELKDVAARMDRVLGLASRSL